MTLRVSIVGGGIKGAALAAFLSYHPDLEVSLIERHHIGAGISSINHGRCHLGTWNYRHNGADIIARNRASAAMLHQLPGVMETVLPSYYCIEADADVAPFLAFCERHTIPWRLVAPSDATSPWSPVEPYAACIEVPEYVFNPARLAARLAMLAEHSGRCRFWFSQAEALNATGNTFSLRLANGEAVHAEVVINALGGWSNTLASELAMPRLNLTWKRWRLLALQCAGLPVPPLERIMTVECATHKPVGALPHGQWVIFGCDVPADHLTSPENLPREQVWRPYDPTHLTDRLLFDAHAPHFPVLGTLSLSQRRQHLFSFSGVYPELDATETYDACQRTPYAAARVYENPDVPHYWVFFGGSATTAVLDAAEVAQMVLARYVDTHMEPLALLDVVARHLPPKTVGTGMIWEYALASPAEPHPVPVLSSPRRAASCVRHGNAVCGIGLGLPAAP